MLNVKLIAVKECFIQDLKNNNNLLLRQLQLDADVIFSIFYYEAYNNVAYAKFCRTLNCNFFLNLWV